MGHGASRTKFFVQWRPDLQALGCWRVPHPRVLPTLTIISSFCSSAEERWAPSNFHLLVLDEEQGK